jgi:hypothetical protein
MREVAMLLLLCTLLRDAVMFCTFLEVGTDDS